MMKSNRQAIPDEIFHKGRAGDPRIGEWVIRTDSAKFEGGPKSKKEIIVIAGSPDDQGVVANRGRAGAKDGPNSIRKHFYKMAMPMDLKWEDSLSLYDYGNAAPSDDIRETHSRSCAAAVACTSQGATLVALGGGHDFAAPCFLGFVEGWKKTRTRKQEFGLINVDPHLDVRELENDMPNSGTPFRQILDSGHLEGSRFVEFGIRPNRNSRSHFAFCVKKKVSIFTLERLRERDASIASLFKLQLRRLATESSVVGVTFDMDSCSDAEGVSAAPVLGFSAWEMCQMAAVAGRERKVRYFEIAEVAPSLDPSERSSRIAAEMIYWFMRARAETIKA